MQPKQTEKLARFPTPRNKDLQTKYLAGYIEGYVGSLAITGFDGLSDDAIEMMKLASEALFKRFHIDTN